LRAPTAPELARDQAGEDNRNRARERGKKPEPRQRGAEELERQPTEKRRDRRISHITPGEMTRIIERGQFVAMKTVAPAGEQVRHHRRRRDRDQQPEIGAPALGWKLRSDLTVHALVDSAFAYSGRAAQIFRHDPEFGVVEARLVGARNHDWIFPIEEVLPSESILR